MASLRRSTTMSNDGTMSKFLYTIMKQLDHKSIDWNMVAAELAITNGHAARMRFSRFRQHMDGVVPCTRKPRKEGIIRKKTKIEKKRNKKEEESEDGESFMGIKEEKEGLADQRKRREMTNGDRAIKAEDKIKSEPNIKKEILDYRARDDLASQVADIDIPSEMPFLENSAPRDNVGELSQSAEGTRTTRNQTFWDPIVKAEPNVKTEPEEHLPYFVECFTEQN